MATQSTTSCGGADPPALEIGASTYYSEANPNGDAQSSSLQLADGIHDASTPASTTGNAAGGSGISESQSGESSSTETALQVCQELDKQANGTSTEVESVPPVSVGPCLICFLRCQLHPQRIHLSLSARSDLLEISMSLQLFPIPKAPSSPPSRLRSRVFR